MTDITPATIPTTRVAEPEERAIVHQQRRGDFMPLALSDALKFAETVQRAEGMIPKAYVGNPGKILACIMAGQELGIGPMASLRAFHVVEGKPCADYTFWVARLKAAGYRVEWLVREQEKVTLQLTSPDGRAVHRETWDKARAVTAGLWNGKDPWKKYPQTMLSARCVTSAGRAFAGEVMFGCYENDEAEELMRDADVVVTTPASTGPIQQRLATAAGSTIANEALAIEQRARECADMAKALQLSRDDVYAIFDELKIPHNEKKRRIGELSREEVDLLAEALDQRAKSGSEVDPEREAIQSEVKQ